MRLRIIWSSEICIILEIIRNRIQELFNSVQFVSPSVRVVVLSSACIRSMCSRVCSFNPLVLCICPSIQSVWSVLLVCSVCLSLWFVRPSVHPVCLAVHTVLLSSSSVRSSGCPSVRFVHPVRPFVGPSTLSVCPCFPSVDTCRSSPCGFVRLVSVFRPVCVVFPFFCLSTRSSKHRWYLCYKMKKWIWH